MDWITNVESALDEWSDKIGPCNRSVAENRPLLLAQLRQRISCFGGPNGKRINCDTGSMHRGRCSVVLGKWFPLRTPHLRRKRPAFCVSCFISVLLHPDSIQPVGHRTYRTSRSKECRRLLNEWPTLSSDSQNSPSSLSSVLECSRTIIASDIHPATETRTPCALLWCTHAHRKVLIRFEWFAFQRHRKHCKKPAQNIPSCRLLPVQENEKIGFESWSEWNQSCWWERHHAGEC